MEGRECRERGGSCVLVDGSWSMDGREAGVSVCFLWIGVLSRSFVCTAPLAFPSVYSCSTALFPSANLVISFLLY